MTLTGATVDEVRSETVTVSPRLAYVEVGGLGAQRAVEDAGFVVEMADHLLGLVGHPDATVVDVDPGSLLRPCR